MPHVKKIKLIGQTITYGNRKERIVKDSVPREVFAEMQGVTQTEFFSASASGFTPEGKAVVWAFEYHGEQILVIDGNRYAIYRTYNSQTSNKMELYYMVETGPNTAPEVTR